MQGLLAKLRTARAQNVNCVDPAKTSVVDNVDSQAISINSLVSTTDGKQAYKNDGQVVPRLNVPDNLNIEDVDRQSESGSVHSGDGFAIDIVMASNSTKGPPKGRTIRNGGQSSKQLLKASRTRGSRISLNSTSERDDGSVSGDSDDETPRSGRPPANQAAQAWAAFEDAVKNIDNSNPEYFTKKPKPNFVSSGTFQKVMLDMYGNTEYGNTKGYTLLKLKLNSMAKATSLATRMIANAVTRGKEEREREEREGPHDEPDLPEPEEEQETTTKVFAKRGWKILKRNVQDTAMENKLQTTKLNWAMLQHTVRQMTNVERTRQDLYERYGILPTRLDDGSVVCENRMLSERARAQLYGNGQERNEIKRPSSYQPPPVHLRSRSQLSFQKKGRNSAKFPSLGGWKHRPKTAK